MVQVRLTSVLAVQNDDVEDVLLKAERVHPWWHEASFFTLAPELRGSMSPCELRQSDPVNKAVVNINRLGLTFTLFFPSLLMGIIFHYSCDSLVTWKNVTWSLFPPTLWILPVSKKWIPCPGTQNLQETSKVHKRCEWIMKSALWRWVKSRASFNSKGPSMIIKVYLVPKPFFSQSLIPFSTVFHPADQALISKLGNGYKVVKKAKGITDILKLICLHCRAKNTPPLPK